MNHCLKICLGLGLSGLIMLLAVPEAMGSKAGNQPPDVGLITQVTGEASYWNESEESKAKSKVQALMKIRRGDRLELPTGTAVKLVFSAQGRQESWQGPVLLKIGDTESQGEDARGAPVQPQVKALPTKVTERLASSQLPLPRSAIRWPGFLVLREASPEKSPPKPAPKTLSDQDRAELEEAKAVYADLKKQSEQNDLTADLYLLSILADFQQYREMEKRIGELLKKQPDDANLQKLKEWTRQQK